MTEYANILAGLDKYDGMMKLQLIIDGTPVTNIQIKKENLKSNLDEICQGFADDMHYYNVHPDRVMVLDETLLALNKDKRYGTTNPASIGKNHAEEIALTIKRKLLRRQR